MKHSWVIGSSFLFVIGCGANQEASSPPEAPLLETGAPDLPDQPALYNYASIQTAMAKAQETLPVFWDQFNNSSSDNERFKVKIIHPSDEYERDYVWVEYLQQAGETKWRQ